VVRYYLRPEETHLGRQRHHSARELFLSRASHYEPVGALLRRARVKSPKGFAEAADGDEEEGGNDVFMCEYEYDEGWKRFKRRAYPGEARDGDTRAAGGGCALDGDWGLGGGSSDEGDVGSSGDEGDAYRPERRGGLRGGRGGGRGGRKHGISELLGGQDRVSRRGGRGVAGARAVRSPVAPWCSCAAACAQESGGPPQSQTPASPMPLHPLRCRPAASNG
jgi:origin recognition complex subunit 1